MRQARVKRGRFTAGEDSRRRRLQGAHTTLSCSSAWIAAEERAGGRARTVPGAAASDGSAIGKKAKGALPYCDHDPWPWHEDNGKCSSAAVLFDLIGDQEAATYFSRMAVAAYAERESGHTGNFFNHFWALPGVARAGPAATAAYFAEAGWELELARGFDGHMRYQPTPADWGGDSYDKWDCTGAYDAAAASLDRDRGDRHARTVREGDPRVPSECGREDRVRHVPRRSASWRQRRSSAAGGTQGTDAEGRLHAQGSKHMWLQNPDNMDKDIWDSAFSILHAMNLKTARAWRLKEAAMWIWTYVKPGRILAAWKRWFGWAARSQLEPIKEVAATIKNHLKGVVNAITSGATSAACESINSKIQKIKRLTCGLRNRERFKLAIFFHLGGLDFYPASAEIIHTKP